MLTKFSSCEFPNLNLRHEEVGLYHYAEYVKDDCCRGVLLYEITEQGGGKQKLSSPRSLNLFTSTL